MHDGELAREFEPFFAVLAAVLLCVAPFASTSFFGNEKVWLDWAVSGESPDVRLRFAAAVARRLQQERFDRPVMYVSAVLGVSVGACGFFRLISLPVLGALFFALLSGGLAYQLLRVERVRAGAQVASLQRRDVGRIVPWWYLSFPVIGWCCSAYIAWASGQWMATAIAVGASILAIALCFVAATAPALLGADDPAADEAVDSALRTLRITQLMFLAASGSFILTTLIYTGHDWGTIVVRFVTAGAYFAMAWGMQKLKKRLPVSIAAAMV